MYSERSSEINLNLNVPMMNLAGIQSAVDFQIKNSAKRWPDVYVFKNPGSLEFGSES